MPDCLVHTVYVLSYEGQNLRTGHEKSLSKIVIYWLPLSNVLRSNKGAD